MTEGGGARMDAGLAAAPVFAVEGPLVRLLGSRCASCEAHAFPRRAVCLSCGGEALDASLSGLGRVHSWTLIEAPPWGFDESLGYLCVDLEEGPRVLAPAASPAALAIGAEVQAVPGAVKEKHEGFRFEVSDRA